MSLEYLCGKQKAHLKIAQLYYSPQESPMPDKEEDMDEFLFVHQSNAQKHLLERYGQEICLLDATYKTCKFDVPLFCVCVSADSGFVVVGLFILPHEICFHIKRGLAVLNDWNCNWKPTYFMTDYDRKEIRAVKETFPGMKLRQNQ